MEQKISDSQIMKNIMKEQLDEEEPYIELKNHEPVQETVEYSKEAEEYRENEVQEEMTIKMAVKKNLTIETEKLDNINDKAYQIKLMSALLRNQNTPQVISGVVLDPSTKKKISTVKKKVLGLEVDINAPLYDHEGNLIYDEDEEEEEPEALNGIFNVHLLDEEVLDQQVYLGSASNSVNSSQQDQQE